MANRRAIASNDTGHGYLDIPDTDTINLGNVAPLAGALTLGGSGTNTNVNVVAGHDFNLTGASDFSLSGTGALQVSASGTHQIIGGDLDVDVLSNFSANMTLSSGADLLAGVGSALSGFDTIEGILSGNLVDKSASETITGQWKFQAGAATNPKLIVQANGAEPADTLLFQVQNSSGANLFSVDTEGDVVIAGGETVAGTTVYTGDITLGDGGNTVQLGSAASPANGDNVFINTYGTGTYGQFSITSQNFNVSTAGDLTTAGNISLTDGGTLSTTNNGNLSLSPNGTGVVVFNSDVLATGYDFGTSLNRLGDVFCTNLDATLITGNLASDGTNSNVWVVNEDSLATTSESSGTVWLSADGADILAWRARNDNSGTLLHFEYKANPTDPKNINEAFTTWMSLDHSAGAIRLFGDLVFPSGGTITTTSNGNIDIAPNGTGVTNIQNDINLGNGADTIKVGVGPSASTGDTVNINTTGGTLDGQFTVTAASLTIDNSGNIATDGNITLTAGGTVTTTANGNLNLTANGTGNIVATATLVDLRTNVTTLDVPSGTGFSIGGTALTTVNWTNTAADIIFGNGSTNADAYHTHSGGSASNTLTVTGLTTAAMTQYQAAYVSGTNTVSPADARDPTSGGSFQSATFAGVYAGTAGEIIVGGKVEVQFDSGLTVNPGDPALLSWNNTGQFTNVPPANGSKDFLTIVGVILDTTNYVGPNRCVILIHPNAPVQK